MFRSATAKIIEKSSTTTKITKTTMPIILTGKQYCSTSSHSERDKFKRNFNRYINKEPNFQELKLQKLSYTSNFELKSLFIGNLNINTSEKDLYVKNNCCNKILLSKAGIGTSMDRTN